MRGTGGGVCRRWEVWGTQHLNKPPGQKSRAETHKTKDINVVGEVHPNQLNKLKREAKLHRLKTQPIFSESSQTEWREACGFLTKISVFPM